MNARQSAARLPEAVRKLVSADPLVRELAGEGAMLEDILSSDRWAKLWAERNRDPAQTAVLRIALERYGSLPFEPEELERRAEAETGLTGAETRVALAKLRGSGVLFALRKTWGDRLLYVPVDRVRVWQPLLAPAECRVLGADETREVRLFAPSGDLDLTLELLTVWRDIERRPIPLSATGAPYRAAIARLMAGSGIRSDGLAGWPSGQAGGEPIPQAAALAIDLGLACGVLKLADRRIEVDAEGRDAWLALGPREAGSRLSELVVDRYCSAVPAQHLAASAVLALDSERWYDAGPLLEGAGAERAEGGLRALQTLGLLELGQRVTGAAVRRKAAFACDAAEPEPPGTPTDIRAFVQPDGDVFVPPGAGLRLHWTLLGIAEKTAAGALTIYRITRSSCESAYREGYSAEAAISFLEATGDGPVPEPLAAAIRDWFAPLGRVRLAEATLLRTADADAAAALLRDPELGGLIVERLNERDFLVDPASCRTIRDRLARLGLPVADDPENRPPDASPERKASPARGSRSEQAGASRGSGIAKPPGWLAAGHAASLFEPDRSVQDAYGLFPGLSDVPAAWVTRPREYHPSTSKQLMLRAIEWQTSVRLERDGDVRLFSPRTLTEQGSAWTASGRWLPSPEPFSDRVPGASGTAFVNAGEVGLAMIVLPPMDELETD